MPFIGGRKSKEGQRLFVDEFLRMETALARQSKERESLACQVARLSGKDSRGVLTDAIKEFIAYAKLQGSQNAQRYYKTITELAQNTLVNVAPKATQVRELLTAIQLSRLATIELTAAQALTEGIGEGLPYKQIYQSVKSTLVGLSGNKTPILGA